MATLRGIVDRLNPGLQARLGLAFAAVAVLAVAANVLGERSVRVVERVWERPPAAAPIAPAMSVAVPVEAPSPARPPYDPEPLLAAVDNFESAVQRRIASPDPAFVRQMKSAADKLRDREQRFRAALSDAPRASRLALERDLENLESSAIGAIAAADRRRTLLHQYTGAVDALAVRVRERLDGAWRILGRVVARQQIVELRDLMDELRQRAAILSDPAGYDAASALDLAAREQAMRKLVGEASRTGARAPRGADWEDEVRTQLAALATAREALLALDTEAASAAAWRAELLPRLQGRIRALPASLPVPPASSGRIVTGVLPAPTPQTVVPIAVAAPRALTSVREEIELPRRRSVLVWISVAVVILTLGVYLLTVRSLMRQVGRVLEGIRAVARGESASIGPGGIRELNVVAAEFNAMSGRLAAARADNVRYQQELEMRVVERTAQLHFQAAHDPLTLLPNRRELHRLLEEGLAAASAGGRRLGVFLIDLDHFKVVNDSMGHGFGDRVLVAMARRLQEVAPVGGFAARLGGDEFTMVSAAADDLESVREAGWALVRAFQRPLSVDGRELMLSVSVGASIFPDHEHDAEALIRAADSALFRAKALGRSQLALFTPEMLDAAAARFSTEQSLRRAVERGEFELVYQPEVDLGSFEVRLVEALLRWRLPDGTQVSPGDFLSVAEESGLITEINTWVLREAVAAAARWHADGWLDVRVAINVSSRQLVDPGFTTVLAELLARHGLPPSAVEIELTENVLQTGPHVVSTLQALQELGVPTALDDFGTGYSSLASLEHLPLSRVKLDQSLIASIDSNPRSAAIARALIQLCAGLGLEVTAEGVERVTQFQLLLNHPALLLQGYLFARPLPESAVLAARAAMPAQLTTLLLALPPAPGGKRDSPVTRELDALVRTGYL